MAKFEILSVDARRAAGVGLSEEAAEVRHDMRPSHAALGTLATRGCLALEASAEVEDGLEGQGLAAALCAAAMQILRGTMTAHGRLVYRAIDGGTVFVSRLGRLDVDPSPVATLTAA